MRQLREKVAKIVAENTTVDDFVAGAFFLLLEETGVEFPAYFSDVLADILERLHPQTIVEMPPRGNSYFEQEKEKQALEAILAMPDRNWRTAVVVTSILKVLQDATPKTEPSSLTTSLMSIIPEFSRFIGDIVDPLFWSESIDSEVFPRLRKQLWANVCIASHMPIDGTTITPRHIWPEHSTLPRSELFHAYLKDTPLQRLSRLRAPFGIPRRVLNSHTAIFAPSDHGKTQLLQALIHDFLLDDPPGMFIIDSHGELLRNLRPVIPKDRLVEIDPTTAPPTIDLFARGIADEDFLYLFSALDQDFTAKQTTTVLYLLRLMQTFERPTFLDFMYVLQDPAKSMAASKYAANYARLDEISRSFFETRYFHSKMLDNRQQVSDRIYNLLASPIFKTMFTSKNEPLSIPKLMAQRKIVLVNTSTNMLGRISPILGRYIIGQCLSAGLARLSLPASQRPLALLIIDEAHTYFDDNTDRILSEARKCNLGLIFATQYTDQMEDKVKASVATNTTTKIAGPVSGIDSRWLAGEMRTVPELIRNTKKVDHQYAEFALFIRNVTPRAIKVQVPFGVVATQAAKVPAQEHSNRSTPPPVNAVVLPDHDDSVNDYDHAAPTEWKDDEEEA